MATSLPRAEMSPNWDTNNRAGCATRSQRLPAASPGCSSLTLPPREIKRPRKSHVTASGVVKTPLSPEASLRRGQGVAPEPRGKPQLAFKDHDG